MASKQTEEIQRKLAVLAYLRANAPAQSLLFAGVERYRLLEWLFFRGDESVGADAHVVQKALDKLISKLGRFLEMIGDLTWEEVFLKAYDELIGKETKLWVQDWIREQRMKKTQALEDMRKLQLQDPFLF
ncbi:hypothetical protein E2562_032246 [Oryza meyeriana var. granulata]|uniref:Uncharacterized protein n=1 Tax=Oryza meyeriana var. granulata TaxID=110450 RepID=A0A6G1D8Z9_9ORYZ|nr:hypothetical protein E2562_032246 [Oryza meyeriana var. granulata]